MDDLPWHVDARELCVERDPSLQVTAKAPHRLAIVGLPQIAKHPVEDVERVRNRDRPDFPPRLRPTRADKDDAAATRVTFQRLGASLSSKTRDG